MAKHHKSDPILTKPLPGTTAPAVTFLLLLACLIAGYFFFFGDPEKLLGGPPPPNEYMQDMKKPAAKPLPTPKPITPADTDATPAPEP